MDENGRLQDGRNTIPEIQVFPFIHGWGLGGKDIGPQDPALATVDYEQIDESESEDKETWDTHSLEEHIADSKDNTDAYHSASEALDNGMDFEIEQETIQ